MLPVLGGSPNVWITTNLFFQFLLCFGYCLSTVLSRISWGRYIYLAFILLLTLLLPLQLKIDVATVPNQPIIWILEYLLATIGATALLLCSVAPLLQFWYGKVKPDSNPYLLYAASNVGSFLGILVYPLFIEPRLGLDIQFQLWRNAYFILLFLLSCATIFTFYSDDFDEKASEKLLEDNLVPPTLSDRLRWVFLAAIPVSLSLSLTSYITQDLGSFPLLWTLPLGLYLLSYIRGFKQLDKPTLLVSPYKYLLIALVILGFNSFLPVPHQLKFLLSTILFYKLAKSIHNYLYECRPQVLYLPQFYLFTAFGGVCGGLINAIIAPNAYKFTIEYAIFLVLCLLINPVCSVIVTTHDNRKKLVLGSGFLLKQYNINISFLDKNAAYLIILASISIVYILFTGSWDRINFNNLIGVIVPLLFFCIGAIKLESTKYQKGIVLTSIIGILLVFKPFGNYLFADRSYFGSLQVVKSEKFGGSRNMLHGITLHGFQADAMLENPPSGLSAPKLSYYGAIKELTEKISNNHAQPINVAIVGLGTGTGAVYATSKDTLDFYEIDPLVIKVATDNNYFSYVNKSKANVGIIQGDARLSLAKSTKKYDLLVLDAFSSDAIPTHLLTKEAFQVYKNKLNVGGIMLVHISNRYFDLKDSVAKTAGELCFSTTLKTYKPTDESKRIGEVPAKWLAIGNPQDLANFVPSWSKINLENNKISVWTDNYSNLLQALRLFGVK